MSLVIVCSPDETQYYLSNVAVWHRRTNTISMFMSICDKIKKHRKKNIIQEEEDVISSCHLTFDKHRRLTAITFPHR